MKSGKTLVIASLAAISLVASGQNPNSRKTNHQSKPPLHASKKEDFRIVDGQTYNSKLSNKWESIPPEDGDIVYFSAKVFRILGDKVLVRVEARSVSGGGAYGNEWDNRTVIICDHPSLKSLAVGDRFERDRFFPLPVATLTNANGSTTALKSYTYGSQPSSTNKPSEKVSTPQKQKSNPSIKPEIPQP